jgi:hypothetical protein
MQRHHEDSWKKMKELNLGNVTTKSLKNVINQEEKN